MPPSHELAGNLLQKAKEDLLVASKTAHDPDVAAWILGFHAQQAIEKALKAVLAFHAIEYPRTHNLTMLKGLLEGAGIVCPGDADQIQLLTPFGAVLRYDSETNLDATPLDRAWATGCASRIVAWAESRITDASPSP